MFDLRRRNAQNTYVLFEYGRLQTADICSLWNYGRPLTSIWPYAIDDVDTWCVRMLQSTNQLNPVQIGAAQLLNMECDKAIVDVNMIILLPPPIYTTTYT